MKYLLYILFTILSCIFYSCQTDEKEFDKTPTQRKRQAIEMLNSELVNNKAGWLVLYFPKTDSLLFSNLSDKIKDSYQYSTDRYGYGGVCFMNTYIITRHKLTMFFLSLSSALRKQARLRLFSSMHFLTNATVELPLTKNKLQKSSLFLGIWKLSIMNIRYGNLGA